MRGEVNALKQIAIIDKKNDSIRKLEENLVGRGYSVQSYSDETEALDNISHTRPDLVISELSLNHLSGPQILREIKRIDPTIPIIIITEHSNTQDAIDSMQEGAYDYFAKPLDTEKTLHAIEKVLHFCLPDDEVSTATDVVGILDHEGNHLIGKSPEMVEIYKRIGQIAASGAAVLIQGESGTGKELVAHAIHQNSDRSNGPFLAVNCAAIPETLLESELFGYEKGAFTGASTRKTGKFEKASGGTIFLDEIGDMSMAIQSKVLRVLQEKEFERVGGNETVRIDTRVITATNKSLVQCMKQGTFRLDLFYRLKVVSIFLPPLRERGDDVLLLAEKMIQRYNHKLNRKVRGLSTEAVESVRNYDWPGNVREMENNIQTAVLLNKTNVLIPEDFPFYAEMSEKAENRTADGNSRDLSAKFREILDGAFGSLCLECRGSIYDRTVGEFEKALIQLALERVGGNQVKASSMLGISRNTLRNRIERFRDRD